MGAKLSSANYRSIYLYIKLYIQLVLWFSCVNSVYTFFLFEPCNLDNHAYMVVVPLLGKQLISGLPVLTSVTVLVLHPWSRKDFTVKPRSQLTRKETYLVCHSLQAHYHFNFHVNQHGDSESLLFYICRQSYCVFFFTLSTIFSTLEILVGDMQRNHGFSLFISRAQLKSVSRI